MVWLTGGGLVICVVMIVALLGYILFRGAITFWPGKVVQVEMIDDAVFLGEVTRSEWYKLDKSAMSQLSPEAARLAEEAATKHEGEVERRLLWTANFDLTGSRFTWISNFAVAEESEPEWAMVVERTEEGRFNGLPSAFLLDGESASTEPEEIWRLFGEHHDAVAERREQIVKLEKDIGHQSALTDDARFEMLNVALSDGDDSENYADAKQEFETAKADAEKVSEGLRQEINELRAENDRFQLLFKTAQGQEKQIPLASVVRMYPANQLGWGGRMGIYLSRWVEFLFDDPREANMEGGVWPSIVGTVTMTLIMALAVVPFGVLAALYLREYAKAGAMISAVRIAINNLAGVPSIVFGAFGLGFFCLIVGGGLDSWLYPAHVAEGKPVLGKEAVLWASFTLALLTLPVVIVATEEALAAVPNSMREGSYGCGASKWQTIRRIVLPHAMPGIMTGTILAMARGAGEVAPLMLVGAVKLAPELPVDGAFPFIHPDRSFMHLGFHIYDLSCQSPDSEAAKPMVFTTTLLLISLVAALNLLAIWLRARLRKRFAGGHF